MQLSKKFIAGGTAVLFLLVAGVVINNNKTEILEVTNLKSKIQENELVTNENVPRFLRRSFPSTDFTDANPDIYSVLTGGPAKDGIPALDEPTFVSIGEFKNSDDIQAIVIPDGDNVKVYPYNILTWHEIVNDTVNGVPAAITFCPLCGSAIVYDRRTSTGETTFGVSGGLLESNMIMFDRATESLWQQSTGEALAGEHLGETLELIGFQLLTMGDVKKKYPNAQILSDDTGYSRNYDRNPYSGYNENDRFIFAPSSFDSRFEAKEIMAIFRINDVPVATPWLAFADGQTKSATIDGVSITLEKADGELTVSTETGEIIPFYFEMWFSFAVQHGEKGVVIE